MSRFDAGYELSSMYLGMQKDLQQQVGQTLPWYVSSFDVSQVDDIYDVGSSLVGRKWLAPVLVPVLGVIKLESEERINDQGFYPIDTLQFSVSPDALNATGLSDVLTQPDIHLNDRIVYEGHVYSIRQVRVRGEIADSGYAIVGVNGQQVKSDEMITDQQFAAYVS